MNTQETLNLVERILGIAIAFSSVQWLTGIVRFKIGLLYGWSRSANRFVVGALLSRFIAGSGIVLVAGSSVTVAALLFIILLSDLIIFRPLRPNLTAIFRMTHILAAVLLIAQLPDSFVQRAVLAAIAGASVLSYLVTGLTKLVSAGWRNGRTLKLILGSRTNGFYPLFSLIRNRPRWRSILAWSVIAFECLFPLFLLKGARGAIIFCMIALLFHVTLAFVMGMNLFPITWGATYPAIVFTASNPKFLSLSILTESAWISALFGWFILLTIWQVLARIPFFKHRSEIMFYFFLYEFYMFAIRYPDPGVRYVISGGGEQHVADEKWKELPVPWRRRIMDGLWNPEHEAKKAIRHVANEIQLTTGGEGIYFNRLADWLRAMGGYTQETKFDFRILHEDSFEHVHHSSKIASNV